MEAQSHAAPLLAQSIDGRGLAQEALARLVSTERAGALALVGDAGIGKSRLAAWAGERGRKARRVVVEGRAVLALAEPLGVVRELVRAAGREGLTPRTRDPLAAGFPAKLLPESRRPARSRRATWAPPLRPPRATWARWPARAGSWWRSRTCTGPTRPACRWVPFVARALRGRPVALLVNMSPSDVTGRPGGGQPVPPLLLLVRSGRR
ncbi:MAG: hypothetical protein ACAH79_10785 [Thermoleophilia bacterium]